MKMSHIALVLMMLASFFITYYLSMTLLLRANSTNNLNKLYQALLMAFWMGLVMSMIDCDWQVAALLGIPVVLLSIAVRQQLGVDERQFAQSMIEHHQMAIDMTKLAQPKLSDPRMIQIAQDILRSQQEEITTMQAVVRDGNLGKA